MLNEKRNVNCFYKILYSFVLKGYNTLQGERFMSTPNKDEVKGKLDQAGGWTKAKVGEATDDKSLEIEGETQNTKGHTQETWGKVKRGVGDAAEAVGDAIEDTGKNR